MAVYTSLSLAEVSESLCAQFGFSEISNLRGISEGVTNTNYFVDADGDRYVLTIFEGAVSSSDLEYFIDVMQQAQAAGICCPSPVTHRLGKVRFELSHKPAILVSFLSGRSVKRPDVTHTREAGKHLATFHLALDGADIYRENQDRFTDVWQRVGDQIAPGLDGIKPGLSSELLEHYEAISSAWPSDLPSGVIHGDLFPDNVFFSGKSLSGMIDFYYACNDMWAYDIAICLNSWCFDQGDQYNYTRGKALLQGYEQVRPLTAAEKEALPILCAGAALRFLITRCYDWLHVPEGAVVTPKDPLEKLRILRFHRHIDSIASYGELAG